MMSPRTATVIGFCAILLWSSVVGLIKLVSFQLGADLPVLLMYSLSTLVLIVIYGLPKLKHIPEPFLISATFLFVVNEVCYSYSISLAQTAQQAIEVGLINYLWPSITVIILMLIRELKFNIWIILGLILSLGGIIYIQMGNGHFSIQSLVNNVQKNPLSYLLGTLGATFWAMYCVVFKRYAKGHNPIVLFFVMITALLWIKLLFSNPNELLKLSDLSITLIALIGALGLAKGLGYAAWNIGLLKGNITLLVTLSYLSPIFASFISMNLLDTTLSQNFWMGACSVVLGSLICWLATSWHSIKAKLQKKKKKTLTSQDNINSASSR